MGQSDPDSASKKRYYRWKSTMDPHEEARASKTQLAYVHEIEGRLKEALEELDVLIYGSPDVAHYYGWLISRAGVNIKNGRLKQAIQDCNEVIDKRQGDSRTLACAILARGVAQALRGDPGAAASDYDAALQLQPDLRHALESRDDRHQMKRQLDQILTDYTKTHAFSSTAITPETIEDLKRKLHRGKGTGRFISPKTGAVVDVGFSWLWTLIFGPLFFAYHHCWGHAFLLFLMDTATSSTAMSNGGNPAEGVGIAHLIYAVISGSILRTAYKERGWLETM